MHKNVEMIRVLLVFDKNTRMVSKVVTRFYGKFCKFVLTTVFCCVKLKSRRQERVKMMTYVEEINKKRAEFDKMIDEYGICMLSSPSIVKKAVELEKLLEENK